MPAGDLANTSVAWADSGANAAVNAAKMTALITGAYLTSSSVANQPNATPVAGNSVLAYEPSGVRLVRHTITQLAALTVPAVDPAVEVGGSRTLGTGALQAAPGNDTRFPASVTGLRYSIGAGSTDVAATAAKLAFPPANLATGGAVSLDCSIYDTFTVLFNAACTITLANVPDGATIVVFTQQDPTTPRTVTWVCTQTIKWSNSTVPAATATVNAVDIYSFKRIGAFTFGNQLPNFG